MISSRYTQTFWTKQPNIQILKGFLWSFKIPIRNLTFLYFTDTGDIFHAFLYIRRAYAPLFVSQIFRFSQTRFDIISGEKKTAHGLDSSTKQVVSVWVGQIFGLKHSAWIRLANKIDNLNQYGKHLFVCLIILLRKFIIVTDVLF